MTLLRGQLFQATLQGVPLRREPFRVLLRMGGEQLVYVETKYVSIAAAIALPREHFHLRDAKRPTPKILPAAVIAKLSPKHNGHLLHDIVRVAQRRYQRPHKRAHGWSMLREQPEKFIMTYVVRGGHLP